MTAKYQRHDPAIEVKGLRKKYGKNTVLGGVDLHVRRGEIYALLGPNGAGKTTTINILSTLIMPDAGTASIAGVDVLAQPRQARRMFALTGQYASVDGFQTGAENLAMMARLSHLGSRTRRARTRELLEVFDLSDAAAKRVADYSGGMRRRLDLAISLIAAPPVLFLDEPTTGLDPRSRAGLWSIVAELAANGTSVLLTTQYLDEAERLADRIGVIDGGTIIAAGTPEELKSQVSGDHLMFSFATEGDARRAAGMLPNALEADLDELVVRMPTADAVADIRAFLAATAENGITVTDIAIVGPSLDDVFLTLTGHQASDDTEKEKAA